MDLGTAGISKAPVESTILPPALSTGTGGSGFAVLFVELD